MPLRGQKVFCVNHPSIECELNSTFNALISVEKDKEGEVSFDLGSGVPVVVFICSQCGYVELYAAIKTDYWKRGSIPWVPPSEA